MQLLERRLKCYQFLNSRHDVRTEVCRYIVQDQSVQSDSLLL